MLLFGCKNEKRSSLAIDDFDYLGHDIAINNQDLVIVDQDYTKALKIASQENKSIFIDFYTTWCAPCKKLDKLVFQNDSIKQILKRDFILLKYDAENDKTFHLSKKHHVSSYPTAIVLNPKGYVVNRKYGFPGNDFDTLSKNVLGFTEKSIELSSQNEYLKGYSNTIDQTKYPKFYTDYIDRTDTKPKTSDIVDFINSKEDFFKEEDFTTLLYFGRDAPSNVGDIILKDKTKYFDLYGEQDVEVLLYFITSAKFNEAISEDNQKKYDRAVEFTKQALSQGWVDDLLPSFEKDYLKAQNKWDEVLEINKKLKDKGKFDNGYINHFSWQVYEQCDDQNIIKKCLDWMQEVTNEEPTYAYLDTYAHLIYKTGDKQETKRIAKIAIEAARKENEKTTSIQKLLDKI